MRQLHIATALCLSLSAAACLDVPDEGAESQLGRQKVTICHIPPGNPANAHTIDVGQPAVQAHLAHGDTLGACGNTPPPQVCPPGETWDCYSAPLETDGIGVCQRGTKTCLPDGSGYGACIGEVLPGTEVCGDGLDNDCDHLTDEDCGPTCVPTAEVCGDGLDNDCDGGVDEGCVCPPGETWDCYSAPLETDGIGTCQRGTKTCRPDGMGYGECVGEITPVTEVCGDGLDNDCDGTVDDGCVVCVPTAEVCGDGTDNDCDGDVDEGCVCAPGSTVACYGGPPGTEGVGECAGGTMTCNPSGTGYGECVGSVTPVNDVCGDGLDNNCDGAIDESCVCAPGTTIACYEGPPGTVGLGACTAGVQACELDGSGYGACVGSVTPTAEVCGDGLDNDCDGQADEGCIGDRIWIDRDRDGIQDLGEAGLAGATLILRSSSGSLIAVAVSAADGAYWFAGVPAGTYYIELIPPFSYTLTASDAGGDTVDSDFDSETGATPGFSFSGGTDSTWDGGLYSVIQT